jgi:phenylalanyl-tRNA synthetase alpha chain
MEIKIKSDEEKEILKKLEAKHDPEGERIKRFLTMPDLSRRPGSPIHELAERIVKLPDFKDFDVIEVPEVVSADISFNLFDFPQDHPARSRSDTYYLDDEHILRTHTTIMWYYYLQNSKIKDQVSKLKPVGSLSYGKVYRKDEIDRHHMNVFHQMDGWYLVPRSQKVITIEDLQNVLIKIAQAVFGDDVKYRFNEDKFPYTDPSIEMEIDINGKWVEVLGSGVVRGSVLKNLGVDPEVYNGWAFGFGLERLAIVSMELPDIRLLWSDDERVKKQLHLGHRFKEVSKYPPIARDISFVVSSDFVPNNYFDLIRDLGGDLVEEVKLVDKYENTEKFGPGKTSYTYHIVYRSNERTLTDSEVNAIQDKIYSQTASQFGAELR